MSYFQLFSNSYHSNHVADDSSTVFDADTVTPDEVPSLHAMPPLPMLAATGATTDYLYNNNETISSSPHSSQEESPANTISELLRRINSRHHPATITTATTTATRNEEIEILTNQSSSSSSKKRPVVTNSSSHSSRKKTRQSSRLKKRQSQDQNCANKCDSENNDDYNKSTNQTVINQSSSSPQTSTTKLTKHELKWRSRLEELRAYKQLHGRADVSQSNKTYKQLAVWVNTQRKEYHRFKKTGKGCITLERIGMLESIGFEWVSQNKAVKFGSMWNKRFIELSDYKKAHGHLNVPRRKKRLGLGTWVTNQRIEYRKLKANKKSSMTPERVEMLNSIGFEWVSPKFSAWNRRFSELSEYKNKYGHMSVPRNSQDYHQLHKWVCTQRQEFKKLKANKYSQINLKRIEMLNSIGFQWSCRPRSYFSY